MAQKDADIAGPLGGPDKATPGNNNGYNALCVDEGAGAGDAGCQLHRQG